MIDPYEHYIKEIDYQLMIYRLEVLGVIWKPKNRYEQWKQDKWPSWLKRWQPVKYGWVKSKGTVA